MGYELCMCIIRETAYHGTTEKNVESILRDGFNQSDKPYEWLGKGVYFFKYHSNASWWAENQILKPENKGQKPCVLKTTLSYTPNQMFDLDDQNKLKEFSDFFNEELANAAAELSLQAQLKHDEKRTWCAACNLFKEAYPEIGIMAYTFTPTYNPSRYVFSPNQRQICVSDNEIIGESLVMEEKV